MFSVWSNNGVEIRELYFVFLSVHVIGATNLRCAASLLLVGSPQTVLLFPQLKPFDDDELFLLLFRTILLVLSSIIIVVLIFSNDRPMCGAVIEGLPFIGS